VPIPVRALIVEDSEDDSILIVRELSRAGYDVTHARVENEPDLRRALEREAWDVVLADYNMPGFSGTAALAVLRERDQDVPFIFVSGTIGEDIAIGAMKAGANDYVIKGNIKRLAPAIERELRDAGTRRERRRAEEALLERTRFAELGAEIGITLTSVQDLGIGLEKCARALVRHLDAAGACLWTLDERRARIELAGHAGLPDSAVTRYRELSLGDVPFGNVVLERRAFFFDSAERLAPIVRDWGGQGDLRAAAGLPLSVAGRVAGVLGLFARAPWTELRREGLQAIADQLAVGVERRRAEEELRRSQERFSKVFHASPIGIAVSTLADGRFIDVNDAFCAIVGYGPEMIGRTTMELALWDEPGRRDEVIARLAREGVVRDVDLKLRRSDGAMIPVLASYESIELAGQACLLSFVHDVSDRVRLEDELRQAQKMEAIGRLAGGVAHDFNNLLTVILGNTGFLLEGAVRDATTLGHARDIQKAAEGASELTQQLLAFSRRQILQLRAVDLNEVVTGMTPMLRRLIDESIAVETMLEPSLRPVLADSGQLEQVIMNLVINARDAMPKGGDLTIETASVQVDEARAGVPHGTRPGAYVRLGVRDTGVGMDEATQARVFEPFFTTKAPGSGTGLGLATVYGIVRQSGGFLSVESTLGAGTTFHVYLPYATETVKPAPRRASPASLGGDEKVLVVEDADPVRSLMRVVLDGRGYRVLEAPDGFEAMRVCEGQETPPDLLVTDVVMPGMSGRELATQLLARYPRMRVIFTSGYTDDTVIRHGVRDQGTAFIQKPFTPEVLLRAVRTVLDAETPRPPAE
jgi:PAS domain S-box-containing protein